MGGLCSGTRRVKHKAILHVLHLHREGLDARSLSQITGVGYFSTLRYLGKSMQSGEIKSLIADPSEDPPRYIYFVSPEYRRGFAEFRRSLIRGTP